jgi:3-oxoacyl-[acyl-carrier protein] reductase
MDLGLAGSTAVVTGGSKGMGLAIAETLAAEGANVAVMARHRGDIATLGRRSRRHGDQRGYG